MKTPISYYGGKQALIHAILPIIPVHDCYTETFFGGGTVFFAKEPARNETINDLNDIVVNFYLCIKNNFSELKKLIDQTLISRTQHQRALFIYRNNKMFSSVEVAWAFWMCANFSFSNKIGGGIKYSNHQSTVVPKQLINKKKRFTEMLVDRIENTHIECNDAITVLKSRDTNSTFHYIDPPYFNADMGHYAKMNFDEKKTDELLSEVQKLKGMFLLSSYNSDLLQEYVERNNWHKREIVHRLQTPRKKMGKKKVEVLVFNYEMTGSINQQKLF